MFNLHFFDKKVTETYDFRPTHTLEDATYLVWIRITSEIV